MVKRRRKSQKQRISFSKADKWIIARYQGQLGLLGTDVICKGPCGRSFPIDIMQVDHINPISKGGKDQPSNLRLLCPTCNRKKSAKRPTISRKRRKPQSPFDVEMPKFDIPF